MAVYGRAPPAVQPYFTGETNNAELEEQLVTRDLMLQLLRTNLQKAQDRMKSQADRKRREISFEVGDHVLLRIQPYRQKSLAKRRCEKLSPRYFGPYRILRKIGAVAYELELPPDSRVHPVFHVSLLKLARGQIASAPPAPLPVTRDWEIDLLPHEVLAHRWVSEAGTLTLELLISWCNRPREEATWEQYDLLKGQFPSFRLEDKSFYHGGSSDTSPIRVYTRRRKLSAENGQSSIDPKETATKVGYLMCHARDPYAPVTDFQFMLVEELS